MKVKFILEINIKNKGLTLLEIIINLAILSIIIIPIISMTLSSTKMNVQSEDKLMAVILMR